MRPPVLWALPLVGFLVAVLGCLQDSTANVYQCQVYSFNDNWSRNNITQNVTAPTCPVRINFYGELKEFAADVFSPKDLTAGTARVVDTWITDARGFTIAHIFGNWQAYTSSQDRAQESGRYSAGSAGGMMPPTNDDQARNETWLSVAYGGHLATSNVILPYSCCGVTAVTMNHEPRVNVPTILRITPEGIPSNAQISWYLDGVRVVPPCCQLVNPGYTIKYTATVNTPGTHTWKVTIVNSINPAGSKTIIWTQVYR